MVAQHLALRHPDLVRSLVLLDTSPAFGMDGTTVEDWLHARLSPLAAGRTVPDIAPQVITAITGPSATAAQIEAAVGSMRRIPAGALKAACRALVRHDLRDQLHRIAVPTLVVVGERDDETPLEYSEAIAGAIPDARLEVLADTGHLSNVESPGEVNALVEKFWTPVEEDR
jgi:pimeloyl-ACP methyl ester carboxylesterase